jgi:glycosyltransferase involved in cell wall biosynthesis
MFRVGLIGWGASTGNGGMNHDIARLAPWVTYWLCPRHPELGWNEAYLEPVSEKVIRCQRENDTEIYDQFLNNVDAVLFIEHPYLKGYELVDECKKRGVFTVCIPMWEWWPERKFWSQHLDMVWCVTKYTRQYLETLAKYFKHRHDHCDWADKIYGDRWGVELEEFEFTLRQKANRFFFANGNGGGRALRKGSAIIAEVAAYIPDIEIIMLTQGDNYVKPMPHNVRITQRNFPTKTEIYLNGDIFLVPTHWEGLGHGLYEAQACGLPVITTDAPPMDECGADWLIPVSQSERYELSGKPIPKVFADAQKLAQVMREIYTSDISHQSQKARERMEKYHDLKEVIKDLGKAIEHGMNLVSNKSNLINFAQTEIHFDYQKQYQLLIKNAWNAYQNGEEERMVQLLTQSLQHTSFHKTEALLNWIDCFENFDLEAKKQVDTLIKSSAWEKLILSFVN